MIISHWSVFGSALLFFSVSHGELMYWPMSQGGNGHYYEAVTSTGINWYQAGATATNKGGYLAAITSPAENDFIFSFISTNSSLWMRRPTGNTWGPWIGGFQPAGSPEPSGGWTWVTGETFGYANWNTGEPSNTGNENCLEFWGEQAAVGDVWNDKDGTAALYGFVIEYDHHPNAALLDIRLASTNRVELSWLSRPNVQYIVEWMSQVQGSSWVSLTNVLGNGGTNYAFDSVSETGKFYRVSSTP
jgi:hypothetical protein